MKIVFEGNSLQEIVADMHKFVGEIGESKPEVKPEVKKQKPLGRPAKPKTNVFPKPDEVPPEPEPKTYTPPVDVELPPEEPVKIAVKITKEQLVEMLQKVNKEKGLPKAREVLAKFSCQRLGELPEEKYEEFYLACRDEII